MADIVSGQSEVAPPAVVGGTAGRAEGPAARPAAVGGAYLEDSDNTVTATYQRLTETYRVKACGCRSRFCERCCKPLGYALRERLVEVLKTFHTVYMVTLTVDPWLFLSEQLPCPELAYFYLRDKRCIANFVTLLWERGFLKTRRFFYIVEWHEKTEFPHYHLVLDAEFIPFAEICRAWNSFRPPWAGPVQGARPGMGSVHFTKSKHNRTRNAEGCARYLSKYLTKHPKHGYPAWVLDADYRIRRFSSNRGFWGGVGEPRDAEPWAGVEDETAVEMEEGESVIESERPMTIRERIAGCGQLSNVFQEVELVNLETGEVEVREEFVCQIGQSLEWVAERLQVFEAPHPYALIVRDPLAKLRLGQLMPSKLGGCRE